MSDATKKKLIGAVIAAALAFAVYYGLVSQQTATSIQNQTNQTLGTTPASQQPNAQPAPQPQATQPPSATSNGTASQPPVQPPRQ